MKAPSILLVDDDAAIRETVTEALTEAGLVVAEAANGMDGLEYLRTHSAPRVILLDWNMPVMDGHEMALRLREDRRWSAIPIVLMTASSGAREKALDINAAGYLRKPLIYDDLLDVVDASLRNPA